jgi:phosphoheptose isomerase
MSGNISLKPSKPDGDPLGNLSILGNSHFALVCKTVEKISLSAFEAIVASIRSTVLEGGRIYIFGNGGSASTAGHIVTDLAQCAVGGRSIRAHSFANNPAIITAWANDVRFEQVFAAEVDRYVNTQDIVVAISVSGRSPNVLAALRRARTAGARTIRTPRCGRGAGCRHGRHRPRCSLRRLRSGRSGPPGYCPRSCRCVARRSPPGGRRFRARNSDFDCRLK